MRKPLSARVSRVALTCMTAIVVSYGASAGPLGGGQDLGDGTFLKWAKSALTPLPRLDIGPPWDDLMPIGKVIGDAKIVGLGDNADCSTEAMAVRNRLFQYLVEKKGFTAIAIEIPMVEGRPVGDYVRGASGDLAAVMKQHLNWSAELPKEAELLRYMRTYNANPEHKRKIDFYGFDIPGIAVRPHKVGSALLEAVDYVTHVDGEAASALRARLKPLLPYLNYGWGREGEFSFGYNKLDQAGRDAITGAIADLIDLLERKEAAYEAITGVNDYEWAYRDAIGARQIDQSLRQIPFGWQEDGATFRPWFATEFNSRDRGHADNIDWILKREGPAGKVLIFSDDAHLAMAPIKRVGSAPNNGLTEELAMGTYLHQRYGKQYVSIGSVVRKGAAQCSRSGPVDQFAVAPFNSLDSVLERLNTPRFFLPLHAASQGAAQWLAVKRQIDRDGVFGVYDVAVNRAYDALIYYDAVTPQFGGVGSEPKDP